jgi:hypothetical protein
MGPIGTIALRLALDTGTTDTVIDVGYLIAVGYDAASTPRQVPMVSGTNTIHVPLITVASLQALRRERMLFPVLGHSLPSATGVDGVLGLDFLRGEILTLDFRNGQITLA